MKHADIIKQMTLEEKCYLMSGKDFWQTRSIERLGVPNMTLSDGPHGIRKQEGAGDQLGLNGSMPATCYPTAATIANSWDPVLGEEIGEHLGTEAASQGVGTLLGPGLNIKRSPFCGHNFEYFSEDPYLAGKMAASYVRGIQKNGVSACPKHFAANSQELRRMASDSVMDERTLREIYLTGFEIAVKEGHAKSIMSSYNRINGVYANENPHLLQEILRDEWGFDGFVVSDWGASNDHTEGVRAGSHLEMPTTGGDSDLELVEAVKSSKISQELLDRRVDELLDVILSVTGSIKSLEGKPFDMEKHHAMAAKASEQSIVLLKNENDILPLKKGTKVAVIGEFAQKARYQGAGSSVVNPTKLDHTMCVIGNFNLDVSSAPYFPAKERTAEYRESLYVGYRYFETAKVPVLFPFGFGLSYTTFEYSDLTVTDKEATFTLKNTGKMDGAEVAQLYVSKPDGDVFRPAKVLKGFAKVFLKAGESKKVTIKLDDKAFRYFNMDTNRFEVEGGDWIVMIGASVADIKLSGTVSVQGTGAKSPYDRQKFSKYFSGDIKNISDAEFEALLGRPIPDGHWSGTLDMNDAICQLYYSKSGLARFVYKIMSNMLNKSIGKGKPDLNITFIYNMPFRGIAKMAGGMCTMEMAEGILTICNGHFFKGLGAVVGGFFRSGRKRKAANTIH